MKRKIKLFIAAAAPLAIALTAAASGSSAGSAYSCYGACAQYWPPLLTHGKPVARAGAKQSLVGTTRRRNGSTQATYVGHPLYRYLGDTRPGQTNGAGLQDFGGGWDPISPSGKKVESGG